VQRHLDAVADVPGAEFFGEGLGPGQVAGVAGRDRRTLACQALADRGADAARAPVTKATRPISLPSGDSAAAATSEVVIGEILS
jgi:hypothetical protein